LIEFFYIKVQAIYINIKDKNAKSIYIEETTNMTKENMQPRNHIEDKSGLIEEQIWQIEIPKIELVAPISEGTSQEVMLEYVGHFEDTNILSGNVGLAAHNRGYPINYFAKLKELEINDEIIYKTKYGVKRYKVILTTIIQDTDWSYLQETEENKITLITCVENKPNQRRCIQGIEIKEEF
jgi:LPXTG-site transpeptidase (sortase) family protein